MRRTKNDRLASFPPQSDTTAELIRLIWERGGTVHTTSEVFDVYRALAERLGLSESARTRRTEGSRGQTLWRSEVGYCRQNLVDDKLLHPYRKGRRGVWELTDRGKASAEALQPTRGFTFPEEVASAEGLVEGAVYRTLVNAYERDLEARRLCIAAHGTSCCVCGFNFGAAYGSVADGYIHVHHLKPLSEVRQAHAVDPVADLRPVCPNCHAVIHRRIPPYSIEEVRAFFRKR